MRPLGIAAAAVLLGVRAAVAQCPDGTPPPCARPGVRTAAVPVDPNRVAVLPFRVTTSDTLLGEGFAELLATQFTGEGGPRAVDMATVLSAWRHAGGGLRSPLPRERAIRLARELGAGLVTEGSIVGLGSRVTISATMIAVPAGTTRGASAPVSGSADSLDALLRRTTTGLLAAVGGAVRADEGAVFTDNPDAMRAYLEGLAAWRLGRLNDAAAAFDRAVALDSAFAQARFRRYLAAVWGIGGGPPYARLAWERRAGLSVRERAILEALLGANYPAPRLTEQRFAARQRLVDQYPDSPDALYFIGDYYFHYGILVEPVRFLDIARGYFERAAAVDSQATVLNHLMLIGLMQRDTALLKRTVPAYDRTDDPAKWMFEWLAAASTGDAAQLAALRRRPVEHAAEPEALLGAFASFSAAVPPRLFEEMYERWLGAITDENRRATVRLFHGFALVTRGRPEAAERIWAGAGTTADEARLAFDFEESAAGLDVAGAAQRLAAAPDSASACLLALWRLDRGGDTTRAPGADRFRAVRPRCARAIEVAALGLSSAPDAVARLAVLDSAVRASVSTGSSEFYENSVLAHAWERHGDARRALVAVRYSASPLGTEGLTGRLAVLAGDTAAAISAYRRYLELTVDAEPAMQPARDSVQAQLARLAPRR